MERDRICDPATINKQHVYPSENNLALLSDKKKVVLLSLPKEIVQAYRRSFKKKIHNRFLPGYTENMGGKQWAQQSEKDGLLADLTYFHNRRTVDANIENTLFVHYADYLGNPQQVVNRIEVFFGLKPTQEAIETAKERYSRRSKWSELRFRLKSRIKIPRISKMLYRDPPKPRVSPRGEG